MRKALVALFKGSILGVPETYIDGEIATKGRIDHHFLTVSGVTVLLFAEMKHRLLEGMSRESSRLNAVAQLAAEADGM